MSDSNTRPLRVFLCHALADKPAAYKLYRYLRANGIDPWLDVEKLVPGQKWQAEISKALNASDAIVVILSKNSITKEGFVQAEIKFALDKALEMPEGRIFLIPAKLEECEVPESLKGYQWVDLFERNWAKRLMRSLNERAMQLGMMVSPVSRLDENQPPVTTTSDSHETVKSPAPITARNSLFFAGSLIVFLCVIVSLILLLANSPLTASPTATSDIPTQTPDPNSIQAGTYFVGTDIKAGIYRGIAGTGPSESCEWARLKDLQQGSESIYARDFSYGQFYVEVKESDFAFRTGCQMVWLDGIPAHVGEYSEIIEPGMYLVGSDIRAGTYRGQAGSADSCYWARLQSVTGDHGAILANDNAKGQFYVEVSPSDLALDTACELEWIGE